MTDTIDPIAERAVRNKIADQLEAEIKASLAAEAVATNGTPSAQAMAVADQVIHRASAAMSDVHAHAMARIAGMREQLDDLENTIIESKERAEQHMQKFMRLVTDGEEAVRQMEIAVARISDQVLTPH